MSLLWSKVCEIYMLKRYLHWHIFSTVLLTIPRNRIKRPSKEDWIKKLSYICSMNYQSAMKKSEILFPIKWSQLETIMFK